MKKERPDKLHRARDLSAYREDWTSLDGRSLILRPLTSDDKQIEKELIDGLSPQSSRHRFFHAIKEATESMVTGFCDVDQTARIAIMAEYNSNYKKRNVGVVRLSVDAGSDTGEFAILVADDFQNSGLGTKFMETMVEIGREKRLKSIYGVVMADNTKMLRLAKESGFHIVTNAEGEVTITRQL